MTRKIVGLTGVISALSVSVAMVLSLLTFQWNFSVPSLHFELSKQETTVQTDNAKELEKKDQPKDPSALEAVPTNVSGLNKAALSNALYGVASEEEEKASTLTSLVLSSHLSSDELGTFPITYTLSAEEYEMLLFCVEFETRSGSLEHKALIAQVIMNRVQGEKFPFTVKEVLTAPGQFDVMPGYDQRGEWTPSEVTKAAVDLVLSGVSPDYAQGARYFCNPYIVGEGNWFDCSLELICEIEGHRFYR